MVALFLCLGQVLGRGELDGERGDETPKRHGVLRCAQLWYGQDAFDLIRKRRAATLSMTLSRDSIALGQAGGVTTCPGRLLLLASLFPCKMY